MSSFSIYNVIQFLAAINENTYKLVAAYFLIYELGVGRTSWIMSISGILFLIPFIAFSSLGGILADKWPKNQIVIFTRFFELICLIIAMFLFGYHVIPGAWAILFFMAALSALFGPSKYGLIPELVKRKDLLWANSVVAALTYLGIIIGTALASFVVGITNNQYVNALLVCGAIAFLGLLFSFFLPRTPIGNVDKPWRLFIYGEIWDSLKEMRSIQKLLIAVLVYSYFLYIGAFVQLNVIPYTVDVLKMKDVVGGYFFFLTAFGLGLGAYMTDKISRGKIRLGLIPLSGIAISAVLILLNWIYAPWWVMIIWMLVLGFLGGIMVVPPQAYILAMSPEEDRGRNFGTANFLSFFFALLASFTIYFLNTLLELSPGQSFFILGVLNLVIMTYLLIKLRSDF